MKKTNAIFLYAILAMIGTILLLFPTNTYAATGITYITLTDTSVKVNEQAISTDTAADVYLSNSMNNGGESAEAQEANIDIQNAITITKSGKYEFTGTLSDGQIAVNADNIQGNVEIVLNNANITCKSAPAIIVYSTSTQDKNCTVTITTAANTKNTITGDRLKQSVEGWTDQDKIVYYVEKDYDDDQTYYERYKYDGAISSDISLTLEGEGTLNVTSTAKEGIEVKRNLTINSGTFNINSPDDGINACTDRESIITINGGNVVIKVDKDAEEGDGIDSNGFIYIKGGTVIALASPTSEDSGLDADLGVYVNGGYVVGTGNMAGELSGESEQKVLQLQFPQSIAENELITITDTSKNSIIAFETDRSYKVLTISSPELKNEEEYYAYKGGKIEGTSENGLYTKITSYTEGTQQKYSNNGIGMGGQGMQKTDNMGEMPTELNRQQIPTSGNTKYYYVLGVAVVLLIITIIIWTLLRRENMNKVQGTILPVIMGILIGVILTTAGFWLFNKSDEPQMPNNMRGQQMMPDRGMENKI